jgi:hypothetical protein
LVVFYLVALVVTLPIYLPLILAPLFLYSITFGILLTCALFAGNIIAIIGVLQKERGKKTLSIIVTIIGLLIILLAGLAPFILFGSIWSSVIILLFNFVSVFFLIDAMTIKF